MTTAVALLLLVVTIVAALPGPDVGYVDVTSPPFNADPTGQNDATEALQAAILHGRVNQLVVFFPAGTYVISDTLNCTSGFAPTNPPLNPRTHPNVLVGQVPQSGNQLDRPTILLKSKTAGFTDVKRPKYMIHFWTYGKTKNVEPNISFNQVFQGINIKIEWGNYGAIGIRHRAAQGSSVQDVLILAGDGLAGLQGAAGSGGSHFAVTVHGGRFGLDLREAQPAPTIAGMTLVNQTCSAILYQGIQTLVAVGLDIYVGGDNRGEPAIRVITDQTMTIDSYCDVPYTAFDPQECAPALYGQMSILDSKIEYESAKSGCQAIITARDIYVSNTYVKNCKTLVSIPTLSYSLNVTSTKSWTQ